jgi:hypothetical protein
LKKELKIILNKYNRMSSKFSKSKKPKNQEIKTVYNTCQLVKEIMLPISAVNGELFSTLERTITDMVCGKCIVNGYVKPNSTQIITYSSGILKGPNVLFNVVFKCDVCFPVSGMKLKCIAKNITKAGIRAESADDDGNPTPFVLYVARDHAFTNEIFNSIKIGQEFVAKVIEQRFELNDPYISIIAQIDNSYERKNFKPTSTY